MKKVIKKIQILNRKTDDHNSDLNRNILRAILFSFATLFISYGLITGGMVFNIVERKALESEMRNIVNEIGELELEYLLASNRVDLAFAELKGFKETSVKKFTIKKSVGFNDVKNISFMKNEL